jgi:hypothetical protein
LELFNQLHGTERPLMEGEQRTRPAGGFATQRGINYQNRVAAFFAVCCLSEKTPVPGLPRSAVQSIRCETGEPLADILLTFESEGLAFVEVKRTIQLTPTRMKPVLLQVIQQYLVSDQGTAGGKFPWRRPLDPSRDRLMLLTSSESPESITKHLAACLIRIGPEADPDILPVVPLNEQETRAFADFHALTLEAWRELMGVAPPLEKVVRLYSLFRIGSLDVNPSEADEQHGQSFLANTVLFSPQESSKAWSSLVHAAAAASESRRSWSRQGIRQALLDAGFDLVSSPSYLPDIRSLREYTRLTLASLDHLATLTVHGRPVRIKRLVTQYLRTYTTEHSLVVVGDPGAGKSGVLHELGSGLRNDNEDVVFLAADRLEESLKTELGLRHDLGDVLENWSGVGMGLLIIDALDAARGSKALTVLRDLIRRVVGTAGSRWRVVASIRVFDLRYSQELQSIFRRPFGEAAPEYFQDRSSFLDLRHIKVPRFSSLEVADIRTQAPELDPVFESATPALQELLEVPFNLRLMAEMLSSDLSNSELTAIETQVGLLGQYWLHRVVKSATEGTARELVLVDVLRALVQERRLTVSKLRLRDAASTKEFASLCSDDVLVEQIANLHGRNIIGFSHHLLFDYAASRLLLAADFDHFLASLASERDLSLFLRPSIDLLFKEAWLKDREAFWHLLRSFSAHERVPAIAKIIGPAVIPELAKNEQDLLPLIEALKSADIRESDLAEQWVVHVVGAVLAGIPNSTLSLWSHFCHQVASSKCSLRVAAVCQSLVDHIVEGMNAEKTNSLEGSLALSHAAVLLLDRFLEMQPRDGWLVGRAISNVMDLFWVNREESARAIRKLITPEEVRNKGAEQGHWISRKVSLLFEIDPKLVEDIYIAFFSYEEESDEQTSMGGSQIMALTSNRRQDYHHTYWQLAQVFPRFLEKNFDRCAAIVVAAVNEYIEREHKVRDAEQVITYRIGDDDHTVLVDYSAIWDGSTVRADVLNIADAYFRKLEEFAKPGETVPKATETVLRLLGDAKYAYIPRRVLGIAKASGTAITKTVYPLLVSESALLSYDLSSAIGDVLKVGYKALEETQQAAIEGVLHHLPDGATGDVARARAHYRDRLLGCIPQELLVLPESRTRMAELALAGGAPKNRAPYVSAGFAASPYSAVDEMRERGVPVDAEPNATLREAADKLWDFASQFSNSTPKSSDVEAILPRMTFVREALSVSDPGVHAEVRNSADAYLVAACAAVAKWKNLDCSTPLGQTVKGILFAGLDSPVPEHHPEHDAQFDRSPSWGAPLQRIEAAAGIGCLLANKKCLNREVLENARRALRDPVPAVRFQIATRLLPLHDTDLAALWSVLRDLVRSERSTGVLSLALYAVMNPLSGRYRSEVLDLVKTVLSRHDLPEEGGDATEWCLRIATGLYLWQGDTYAYAVIEPLIQGTTFLPRRSAQCLNDIREALTFSSDVPKESDSVIRKRSFGLIEIITRSASVQMERLLDLEVKDRTEQWQTDFQGLARLIDYIGNQLYFSSGAYDGTNSTSKLDDDARRTFWEESRDAITRLSSIAIPSVAHHLIETLQSFVPFAPAEVFHAISNVVNSAKSWGYQYESMAVDLLVKVTERYLAEQRIVLQQDPRCREELIDILETFVSAGWPSARRLSYRLEEIFR